ncbi:uncharacterized protein LOC136041470 [Artemia franciscana]|uniref:uncharacterized protein LOC136041470 n=1 Tax=Artemia franciscana TaxID=6661 RepID=UPI0032DAB35F
MKPSKLEGHLKRCYPDIIGLTELDLSYNEVTDVSLESAFASCSLKKLSLRECSQGCRGVTSKTLDTVKTYCPKLRYLRMSDYVRRISEPNSLDSPPLLKLDFVPDYDF